ncbi:MAG: hypothetical protein ABFD66_10040 [Smithella sp.]
MINRHNYRKRWNNVPMEKCPAGLCRKVVRESGILNRESMNPRPGSHHFYTLGSITMTLLLLLMVGTNLRTSDMNSRERFTLNTVSIFQEMSAGMQKFFSILERSDFN